MVIIEIKESVTKDINTLVLTKFNFLFEFDLKDLQYFKLKI